jgi:hypothetical protein
MLVFAKTPINAFLQQYRQSYSLRFQMPPYLNVCGIGSGWVAQLGIVLANLVSTIPNIAVHLAQ